MSDIKEKNFISAVVYVHNDSAYIYEFLKNLIGILERRFEHSEIVCVNDFSSDDSTGEIKRASAETVNTALTVINLSYFHGLETAMNAGLDLAIGDFVVEFDTAGTPIGEDVLMKVYSRVLEGYDIVSASPDEKQKLTSNIFYFVYAKFSDAHTLMRTETFRILTRRAINRISAMSRTLPYRKGIYNNCGLNTDNIRYKSTDSPGAKSTGGEIKRYRKELAFETLVLFTNAGYAVTKFMTSLMMFISVFMIVYTVAVYASANPVEGWTTTILFLSVAFFGLFAILTIIVRYLQILVDLNFKRTRYSYSSIEKLTK